MGCGPQEEFRGCSDVRISGKKLGYDIVATNMQFLRIPGVQISSLGFFLNPCNSQNQDIFNQIMIRKPNYRTLLGTMCYKSLEVRKSLFIN